MRPWLSIPSDWRRPTARGSWQLWWSDQGGFGCVYPRPAAEEIAAFYAVEDYFTHDSNDLSAPGARHTLMDRLRVALAYRLDFGRHPDAAFWRELASGARRALELGSGNGDRMLALAPFVPEIVGVEPDAEARVACARKGLKTLPGTAESPPPELAGQVFDLVVMTHVLEHCLDPAQALATARRLISPKGRLVLETPNNAALGLWLNGRTWIWLDVPRHLNFFTPASLAGFARRAGFKVERIEYWGFCRQVQVDWLATEALIAQIFAGEGTVLHAKRMGAQRLRGWVLLALAAFAPAARKYDSVRLLCRPS